MDDIVKPLSETKNLLLLDILDRAHVEIISIDNDHRITLVNSAALSMFGYE
jgi:PAS domain S-box-containing protein